METIVYLVETDKNFFKISIPKGYKVTFGPLWVRQKDSVSPRSEIPMALRVYEGTRVAAIFLNVVHFRQADLRIEMGEFHKTTNEITWSEMPLVEMRPVEVK